jgi:hypothetical protein
MVSDAAPVARGHLEPSFPTKEPSAPVRSLRDRHLSETEVESFNQETASAVVDEEVFVEARQNGTTGHQGTVLPFHPIGQTAGQATPVGNGEVRRIAQREEPAVPAPALKPARPTAVKPRVKPEVKKEGPETMTGTKPPRVGVNIEWVQKGVGWDCREVYYVGKQRRRRHLGHIGRQKWEEMQQQFGGPALEAVLREWIEARRAEKSMGLGGK